MGIAFLGLPAGYFLAGHSLAEIGTRELLFFGGYLLGFALLGKLAGFVWGRMRMILLLGRITRSAERTAL